MKKIKPKVIRITPAVHKRLLRLAELEQRDPTAVADRLLGAAIDALLPPLGHYNKSGDQHPED